MPYTGRHFTGTDYWPFWGIDMRNFVTAFALLSTVVSAAAAPPASCVNKFAGEWQHGGLTGGNRGTLTRDGRAICSQNAACQAEGTWTCAGNTMLYTTSMGSWTYTLQPDGSITANGGAARATRIGAAPAIPKSKDYGAASNVTADVLGIDRTAPAAATASPAPTAPSARPIALQASNTDPEVEANVKEGKTFFDIGVAAAKRGDWSAAEDSFSVAAARFRTAKRWDNAEKAASNARLAERKRLHPIPKQTAVGGTTAKPKVDVRKDSLRDKVTCANYRAQLEELTPIEVKRKEELEGALKENRCG